MIFLKLQNLAAAALFLGVAACAPQIPDPRFSRQTLQINGTVWMFEPTGQPVIYGGPVGLILDETVPVITFDAPVFQLNNAGDVMDIEPSVIENLILSAATYCQAIGSPRSAIGAVNIFTTDTQVHLLGTCRAAP